MMYINWRSRRGLGCAGKPFRELFWTQSIKKREGFSDHEVIDAIRDIPALQYFIGLPDYRAARPFIHVILVKFRERIAPISELIWDVMADCKREVLQQALPDKSVLIIDATAMSVNIKFSKDTTLLNGARLKLESDIKLMSKQLQVSSPRTYKREAQRQWVAFSRHPRRWVKT